MEKKHFFSWAWFTTIILILLKAFGLIDLGWIWVFAPVWVIASLALVIFGIAFIISLIIAALDN